ncbi:YcnI family copper-binding membrane protein [Streptomyces violascens]|uniref:Membrane protein n=1 Tax=Streptomyces violascens TaxID=67381 RepID=A0ABQ3R245_9ACTN|nr:YcnI family protein [Streptomyces violascens]GGU32173.1 membrane protein [Streptomyces violascens]GHI43600.1 membrane protein [Streptomyces violascens]
MPHRTRTWIRRTATLGILSTAGVLLTAGGAWAHVTVQPGTAAPGATDQAVSFRVPNEEDQAGTTKVEVFLPTDHPIASTLIAPIPGWTEQAQTTKLAKPIHTDDGDITEAVTQVTWSGGTIAPGHYQDFTLDFGQLPSDTDRLTFKALQTYSNGDVVRWIDASNPGQPEPQHPAPVLSLVAPAAAPKTAAATVRSTNDSTARAFGIAGLGVGALSLAAAAYAVIRLRRTNRS